MRNHFNFSLKALLLVLLASCGQIYDLVKTKIDEVHNKTTESPDPIPVDENGNSILVSVVTVKTPAKEDGNVPGTFRVLRSSSSSTSLKINYTLSGKATNGLDYQVGSLSGTPAAIPASTVMSVVIPPGAVSADINIVPITDTLVEGTEDVVISLVQDAAYARTTPKEASLDILDKGSVQSGATLVKIEATVPTAKELGQVPGKFTITRYVAANDTIDLTGPLTVNLEISPTSTATFPDDYTLSPVLSGSPKTITIPAGQPSVDLVVTPIADNIAEGNETVIGHLLAGSYTLGAKVQDTVIIIDDIEAVPLLVKVSATKKNAAETHVGETPKPGQFKIEIENGMTAPADLLVKYQMTPSNGDPTIADNGVDYLTPDGKALSGQATILAGQSSVLIDLSIVDDSIVEQDEDAIMTLVPDAGYVIDAKANTDFVVIADNDAQVVMPNIIQVTAAGQDGLAKEPASATDTATSGKFTISRSGDAQHLALPVTVNFTQPGAGTATLGDDYDATFNGAPVGTSVTIPANQTSVGIVITPKFDTIVEGNETVILTLTTVGTPYTINPDASAATVVIADTNSVVQRIKPAFAVRGAQCLTCHANIQTTGDSGFAMVTDFGRGTDFFFKRAFGLTDGWQPTGTNNPLNIINETRGRSGWHSAIHISGSVIVPSAPLTAAEISAIQSGPDLARPVYSNNDTTQINTLMKVMNVPWTKLWKELVGRNTSNGGEMFDSTGSTAMSVAIQPPAGVSSANFTKVVGRSRVVISPPTSAEILQMLPPSLQSAETALYYQPDTAGASLSGLNKDATQTNAAYSLWPANSTNPKPKFVRNTGDLNCEGDLVIKGTIYLKNLNLVTGPNGCRIYATDTVFIEGPITSNRLSNQHNLQIASGKAILMGFNMDRLGFKTTVAETPSVLRESDDSNTKMSCSVHRRFKTDMELDYYGSSPASKSAFFDSIALDARKIGTELKDANDSVTATSYAHAAYRPAGSQWYKCDSSGVASEGSTGRLKIDFAGVLLAAPHVHSSYLGNIKGVIIAEVANSVISQFSFTYDAMFDTVPYIFPRFPRSMLEVSDN